MKTYTMQTTLGKRTVEANCISHAVEMLAIQEVENHEILNLGDNQFVILGEADGEFAEITCWGIKSQD